MNDRKDIVKAFREASHSFEIAVEKISFLQRMGTELLTAEECVAIDEEMTVTNTWMSKGWNVLGEFKKKAPLSVEQQKRAEAMVA